MSKKIKLNRHGFNRGVDRILGFQYLCRQIHYWYLQFVRGHLYKDHSVQHRRKEQDLE